METTNIQQNTITLTVSADELIFLANAINEALEAVEEWEFETRTGETRKRALQIHAQLQKILVDSKLV